MVLKNPSLDYFKLWVTANANNILQTQENPQGVGVLFLLAFPKIAKKNPHPPWGVWRETPVPLVLRFFL